MCEVFSEVDDYIDTIFKEIKLPPLVIKNQLLMHDQLNKKWRDDQWNRMIELRKHEGLFDGMLEKIVVDPTKDVERI